MPHSPPLALPGTLVRRYKRFLADIRLGDGRIITAHCPNSGSMKTCAEPGRPVWVSESQNPKRKLRYTWELIRIGRTWVAVHSARSNHLVAEWVGRGCIPELAGYPTRRREVAYGESSRIDLLLHADGRPDCYVEVKHSTMRVGREAAFPDAVTTRGRKHLDELVRMVAAGRRAMMFYVVGRADCDRWRPADEIDPDYGATLRRAVAAGVEIVAYRVAFNRRGAELRDRLPISLA